jgi:predicted RNA-binding protein with PIN domain
MEAALNRVRDALANALNPAPELARLATELEGEAARLRAAIQPDHRQAGGLAETLRARMATLTEGEDLNQLHALLAQLGEAELVPALELQALYAAYQDRMAQLYDRYAPARPKGPEPTDPAWALMRRASDNEEFLLLVDGHNVLHGIPELFAARFEAGLPGMRARARLVQLAAALVCEASSGEVRVYFDGPTRSDIAHGANVKEIYSGGGKGEQRADEVILEDLRYWQASRRAQPWILVTDDRDLRAKARDLGATTMPVAQFAAVLARVADSSPG